jgi:hypothetical protein
MEGTVLNMEEFYSIPRGELSFQQGSGLCMAFRGVGPRNCTSLLWIIGMDSDISPNSTLSHMRVMDYFWKIPELSLVPPGFVNFA